jgi:peptidoglycan/LPS O-acetylase OafA/YrhL
MQHARDFRSDIAGLRAVAVIAVVLFHFEVAGWHGGFVGVDIFFVISGFLMTMLVVGDIERGRFSLVGFYLARARRIVPALLLLCALLLLLGAFWLTPPDYKELAQQSAWSALFASNFDFLRDLGYFNVETRDAWLLHTWSLSVEWQFYLLFPLVILALRRWFDRRDTLLTAMAIACALSFLLCALISHRKPVPAFYLLPTRAWEMLAGGLVFFGRPSALSPGRARALCALGLVTIVVSVWCLRPGDGWPGYAAALPVIGAALVLAAADVRNPLLANPAAQWVGNSSYSIYLWHWPVAVALDQLGLRDAVPGVLGGLAAALLLGGLSWRFVETPGRRWFAARSPGLRVASYAAAAAFVAGAGVAISAEGGLPSRPVMRDYARYAAELHYTEFSDGWCVANENRVNVAYDPRYFDCATGDRAAARSVLLWGDSHAGHYAPMVSTLAQAAHLRVRVLSTPECSSVLSTKPRPLLGINPDLCLHFKDDVRRSLHEYTWVILASRWDGALVRGDKDKLRGLRDTLDLLQREGVHAIVLAQVPLFDTDVAERHIYREMFGLPERTHYPPNPWGTQANQALRALVSAHANAVFVDPASLLCRRADAECDVQLSGVFAYSDDQHLSMGGALALAQRLVRDHANFLDPRDAPGLRPAP